MKKYKIILADDHAMFLEGLKGLISKTDEFDIVGIARNGSQLLDVLRKADCDLVITDLSMPEKDGIATLGDIRNIFPELKVLVLTMQKDQEHFKKAMSLGAAGYILKDEAFEQLSTAIKQILNGKIFISPSLAQVFLDQYVRPETEAGVSAVDILTRREQQVLTCVAQGLANKNIAMKLNISARTVETHRSNIIKKLGIKTTAGLVKYALLKKLI